MEVLITRTREYLDYIERHYENVQEAWSNFRPELEGEYPKEFLAKLDDEIKEHDVSKLSDDEFIRYRDKFYPEDEEENRRNGDSVQFNLAWKHHKESNNHHWQNWSSMLDGDEKRRAIIHNVIDWSAMGVEFGNNALDYYRENRNKIVIDSIDRLLLEKFLKLEAGEKE